MSASRVPAVFIRKSSQAQDEGGQIANVRAMLREIKATVPDQNWIVGTVSRRKVKGNAEFNRLMEMVESDRVSTIYIESQDRWGTADRPELFTLLGILRAHDTCLYDLRAKKDLTERDLATEMLAFVNSIKSEKELQDISYRSLRTRVNNFKERASWPTGTHPFGYGKACYAADGALLWIWQPVSRSKGQIFYAAPNGETKAGPTNVRIPRKNRYDKITLVPSNNAKYVEAVKLVFDLYTRVGLSRRKISARLNQAGHRFYTKPFTHSYVTQILSNPAYVGDVHFGKTQAGELHTFDSGGVLVEIKRANGMRRRAEEERIIQKDCHQPLVDRATWRLAQNKLTSERQRVSYAPRNPAYYLKQLFVCGHCGKGLTGRTYSNPNTGERTAGYVCPTYIAGSANGHPVGCGYHFIAHADAERLLLDKVKELNLQYDAAASTPARANLQARLKLLGRADEAALKQWDGWIIEGIDALVAYLDQTYNPDTKEFLTLRKLASEHFWDEELSEGRFRNLPVSLAQFRNAIAAAELAAVADAKARLATLQEEHKAYTKAWVRASELQQAVIKEEVDRLEHDIATWQPRAVSLSHRLQELYAAERERASERDKLLAEWPALDALEKGEALRRLFATVTLFWDRTFRPASANPTRPRKTNRPGRFSYALATDRIQWQYVNTDLGGTW
jgi:hypothetical protein